MGDMLTPAEEGIKAYLMFEMGKSLKRRTIQLY
jgi:hypothetical protein